MKNAKRSTLKSLLIVAVVSIIAASMATALGHGGMIGPLGLPVIGWSAMLAFAIQWLAFVPSFIWRTEHFFDLTGAATFLSVVGFTVWLAGATDLRSIMLTILVSVWAVRLGAFLFIRVRRAGADGRFDVIKHNFGRLLVTWTLQGLWVFLTAAAALTAIASSERPPLGVADAVGLAVWGFGFAVEVVADTQKTAFKKEPANAGRFIATGLWAWSRHPNYFGEIVLWTGVAIVATTALSGWGYLALLSPLFVFALLRWVSGVPMLEKRSDARWGDDDAYQRYKSSTPLLLPVPRA